MRSSLLLCCACCAAAFKLPTSATSPRRPATSAVLAAPLFGDPLRLHSWRPETGDASTDHGTAGAAAATATLAVLPALLQPLPASAAKSLDFGSLDNLQLDPSSFTPVCPASDNFYRFGQTLVVGVVGQESYKEYAPLIAGGLLRVRLELCVVESFFYEAIIPFIKENGLSWVLPLHETVETFLAGTVFAVATNFILLGSTKIITVLATYADIFLGFPFRVVGGIGWRGLEDKALAIAEAEAPPEKPRPW